MSGKDEKPDRRAPRPANKRGMARLAAVQALYQMDVGGADLASVMAEFEAFRLGREIEGEEYLPADADFFRDIMTGVVGAQRRIDPRIHAALTAAWPLKRLDATLRALLRSGCFELMQRRDVPARVVISEYVEVARAFFEDGEEPRMVNGVLDTLAHQLRPDEFAEGGADGDGRAGTGA